MKMKKLKGKSSFNLIAQQMYFTLILTTNQPIDLYSLQLQRLHKLEAYHFGDIKFDANEPAHIKTFEQINDQSKLTNSLPNFIIFGSACASTGL